MFVFDATPLITLAKSDHLDIVTSLDEMCLVPERVHAEVVEDGLAAGYPDARRVRRAIDDGDLTVRACEESPLFDEADEIPNLSEADVAVLALAAELDATAVMDETAGRAVAETENIRTRGTAYLVLRLVRDGAVTADDGRELIDDLLDAGWYCSPDLYAKLLRKLETLDDVE